MDNFSDEALIREFVIESREHLAVLEPDLLTLEQSGSATDPEVINRVFRAIHSIKGAAGFFNLEALKNLSHTMESLLMQIRDGQIAPTPTVIDPLLKGVDLLERMLADVPNSHTIPYEALAKTLDAILSGQPLPGPAVASVVLDFPVPAEAYSFEVSPERLDHARAKGQSLYELQFHLDDTFCEIAPDLDQLFTQMESVGDVIDAGVDPASLVGLEPEPSKPPIFRVLYGTVLEAEMLALAIQPEPAVMLPYQPIPLQAETVMMPDKPEKTTVLESASIGNFPEAAPFIPLAEESPQEQANLQETPSIPSEPPVQSVRPEPVPTQKGLSGESGETIRVRVDLLNTLMDLAGEMVLSRNQLLRNLDRESNKQDGLGNILQNLDRVTSDLQEHIMQTRMQPIGVIFSKFPRIVRDLARQLDKAIDLQCYGEDVELDKTILESLSAPLTHLIRNACDHAVEPSEERLGHAKAPRGTVTLRAYHEGGQIHIAITDDGRGIDPAAIARKVIEKGLMPEKEVRALNPTDLLNLIFLPGFSTAETVSDVSGRGVGMDVVKTNIAQLGGTITIESVVGQGTSILLRLPLTLAIIPSLIVAQGTHRFAIPQISLVELVHVCRKDIAERIEHVGKSPVLRLRQQLLPLIHLEDVLSLRQEACNASDPASSRQGWNILVLKSGSQQFGLVVEDVLDMEEIVVKPLSGFFKNCRCFAGATILGDGCVAMILDMGGLVQVAELSFTEIERAERRIIAQAAEDLAARETVILFHNAREEVFGLPLKSLSRLERINLDAIQRIGGAEYVLSNGKHLKLLRLEQLLPVSPIPRDLSDGFLLIPKSGQDAVALLASEILDTQDIPWGFEAHSLTQTQVIQNQVTTLIDDQALLQKAGCRN